MSCSALKRSYRDQIRGHCASAEFLQLSGSPELINRWLAGRRGHFIPSSLLKSQSGALEPPAPDEHCVVVDAGETVEAIVGDFLARSAPQDNP